MPLLHKPEQCVTGSFWFGDPEAEKRRHKHYLGPTMSLKKLVLPCKLLGAKAKYNKILLIQNPFPG